MKYIFEEREIQGGHTLDMYLKDVPTLEGSLMALECLFVNDLGGNSRLIEEIQRVLNGETEKIDSGSNMFWYEIMPAVSSFQCTFEDYWGNFTISTQVLLEIATTWNDRLKEFCKKYKIR